jgi:hypothetical protein
VFARITLSPPPNLPRGAKFHITVNAPDGTTTAGPDTPGYAGTFRFFGASHHSEGPVSITIRLNDAVARLSPAGAGAAAPLRIQVHLEVPPQASAASAGSLTSDLLGVQVGTF